MTDIKINDYQWKMAVTINDKNKCKSVDILSRF